MNGHYHPTPPFFLVLIRFFPLLFLSHSLYLAGLLYLSFSSLPIFACLPACHLPTFYYSDNNALFPFLPNLSSYFSTDLFLSISLSIHPSTIENYKDQPFLFNQSIKQVIAQSTSRDSQLRRQYRT